MAPPSPRISTYLHTLSLHAALPISIDLGLFPLGSCTMKHNPRLNEKIARLPGFADVHPLAPVDTVQGALGVINELAFWLIGLTGMHGRSEEHTSELQSLMRISYAVFCLKKKKPSTNNTTKKP